MGEYDNLSVEHDGAVAHVRMESESPMNSLSPAMAEELLDASIALSENDDVRCITLTGTGEVYSAGADLGGFDGDAGDATKLRRLASTFHDALIALHQAETPIVGAVNGVAAGAGFSLAIFPDVVLVSEDARMEYAYPRVGLTGDGGSTFLLPRLVGMRRAKEIVLLDRTIDAERAVELGLATEVVPADELEERRDELADRLASGPTAAFGSTLRLLGESFERGFEGQMAAETEAIAEAAGTEDYRRGYAAFFGEEEPEFTGS